LRGCNVCSVVDPGLAPWATISRPSGASEAGGRPVGVSCVVVEEYLFLCVSAFLAGGMNSRARGRTPLTFPALFAVLPGQPVVANGTSTVALLPGSLAAAWGYRKELRESRRWLTVLVVPSLVGGVVGTLLVTRLPQDVFATLVPWLILTA